MNLRSQDGGGLGVCTLPHLIVPCPKQAQLGIFWPKIGSLSPKSAGKLERIEYELGHFVPLLTQLGTFRRTSAGRSGDGDGGSDTLPHGATQGAEEFLHGVHACDGLLRSDRSINLR